MDIGRDGVTGQFAVLVVERGKKRKHVDVFHRHLVVQIVLVMQVMSGNVTLINFAQVHFF